MGNAEEFREAKRDGAKLVKNSGRGFHKGDALIGDEFMVDYKHNAKSFSLTNKNWKKLVLDAWGEDRRSPIIKVIFEDDTKIGIIDWAWLQEFIELYEFDKMIKEF